MSRRVERLTPAQAVALLCELSDSDGESDSELHEDDSGDEEDELHHYVDPVEDAAVTDQPQDESPPRRHRRELTRSQQKLQEADLRPQAATSAGPYQLRDGRQRVVAEWITEPQPTRRGGAVIRQTF